MRMKRYFFISSDMDDLERLEEDLERAGIVTPQCHVLTLDDAEAESHRHLNQVKALMKRDLVHSTLIGAVIGAALAVLVLIIAGVMGWSDTAAGWLPFIFLAVITFGFFTWEGGLRGIETPNQRFRDFEDALQQGRHVFFVDLEPGQEALVDDAVKRHPTLEPAGTAAGAPHWVVHWQHRVKSFFVHTFP
ncbi:NAD/FAD-utilizing enzyme [Arhodomonas sp. SL1]|uniref:NAD/FAD-utilizing enzyme n=1 Tax=Arhodomonas sp. SL1 TaxID=3425691 RepID=UPI003F882195